MDPAKVKAWRRFFDRVVSNPNWPRRLWFAAVEDALAAALGSDSRLVADYRADVGELLGIERAARGTYHDERRVAELEGRIKRLIELADETIREAESEVDAAPAVKPPRIRLRPVWAAGLGALLFLAGVAGATAFHERRLGAEVERQMRRIDGLLDQRIADLRADLDQRLEVAERLNADTARRHEQFSAELDQLSGTMAESMRSMTALSEQTVSELERRLDARGSGVSEAFGRLHARAAALDRGFDDLGKELSSLRARLPKLAEGVQSVAADVEQLRAGFDQASAAIEAVQSGTPELADWLARQKGAFEQDLRRRQSELTALTTQVGDLEDAVETSRGRLQGFNQSLEQDLRQAKQDGTALQSALEKLRATGQQASELMTGADAKVAAAQQAMQGKIDQILSGAAEKADLAVLRSQDVVQRAQAEVTRKLETESQRALDELAKAREARLAELAQQVSATQVELEQTRAGLLASWQGMDQAVAERHSQVLAGLDGYARTIQARIQDLLKALDVKVAGSGDG